MLVLDREGENEAGVCARLGSGRGDSEGHAVGFAAGEGEADGRQVMT